jgi:RNA polymerase sigma-70 factor (ECF subfamily)
VDDAELLARLSRGDEEAFDAIFRTWYARLVRVADGLVRDPAVAEELVQDVMLELWRRREQLAPGSAPQAYLFQATRNRALNHLRHRQVQRRAEPQLLVDEPRAAPAPSEIDAADMDAAVRRAVEELPPRCREVFELSRVHGLRYAEIATTLGVSVKAVEAQMTKALRTLRERLAPWLPGGQPP